MQYRLLMALWFLSGFTFLSAQERSDSTKFSFDISTDLMSRYVWRGVAYSSGPSIQPNFQFSKGGFTVGAWGAYSFNGAGGAEADIFASYSFLKDAFTVSVTDYFFPNENGVPNNYFEYDKNKTGHVYEAGICFNGTDKIPVSFFAGVNFYGNDAKKINSDPNSPEFNEVEGIQNSMYLELGYSFTVEQTELNLFAGFTPNKPRKTDSSAGYIGETGFYGDTMGFVNLGLAGTKTIEITDKFALPLQCALIVNPMAENIYIVLGLSL